MTAPQSGGGPIPPPSQRIRRIICILGVLCFIIIVLITVRVSDSPFNLMTGVSTVLGALFTFLTLFTDLIMTFYEWLVKWPKFLKQRLVLLWAIVFTFITVVLAVVLLFVLVVPRLSVVPRLTSVKTSPPCSSTSTTGCAILNVNGDPIGLSDGRFAFDTGSGRTDGPAKQLAADKLSRGDSEGARSMFQQAIRQDSSDAEAQIYLNNLEIGQVPSITLVVGVSFSQKNIGGSRDLLQGAAVAQRESNTRCQLLNCQPVRLLIAKSGSVLENAATVAKLIQQTASNQHIVGVMGWDSSIYTIKVLAILTQAHIPIVSASATTDDLTDRSPYFFRVIQPASAQGKLGALYAERQLQAKRVVLFEADDTYSQSLAKGFKQQFTQDGNTLISEVPYRVGSPQTIRSGLQDALQYEPDLIYFSGYASDASELLTHLPSCTSSSCLQVMAGSALYLFDDYTPEAQDDYTPEAQKEFQNFLPRLHVTADAYHSEWEFLHLTKQRPAFFDEYTNDFAGSPPRAGYGYNTAGVNAILAYDAMQTLLQGCNLALKAGQSLTAETLRLFLTQIKGSEAVQGVSGRISFDDNTGNPTKKAVVLLHFNAHRQTQIDAVQGCFLKDQC